MRSLLFISILLYYGCSSFSQSVFKGRLVSGLTGKPVKSALIEKNGKLVAGTDSLGYFSIELDSATNVELSFSTTELGNFSIGGLQFTTNEVSLISFQPDCDHSPQKDIKENKVKLLMIFNAFSPPLGSRDKLFEKKYKVMYHGCGDGCTGIITDCIETYNKAIGQYLDLKYGKAWRKEVNKDVMGL